MNKKFNKALENVIETFDFSDFRYAKEDIDFQKVIVKKIRNKEEYNIIVSVNDLEISMYLIREIIDKTCQIIGINSYRVMIEL